VVQECEQGVSRWIDYSRRRPRRHDHDSKSPAPGVKLIQNSEAEMRRFIAFVLAVMAASCLADVGVLPHASLVSAEPSDGSVVAPAAKTVQRDSANPSRQPWSAWANADVARQRAAITARTNAMKRLISASEFWDQLDARRRRLAVVIVAGVAFDGNIDPAADPLLAFLHHWKIQGSVWLEGVAEKVLITNSS